MEPRDRAPFLIIGLGNPGREYRFTRHNVGFRVIDAIAETKRSRDFLFHGNLWLAEVRIADQPVALCKPDTYMNLSGDALPTLAGLYGGTLPDFLVICDDVSLPLGTLRLRRKGSAGGQNGLQSIIDAAGTIAIPRLRCGIGPAPDGVDLADFVLSAFTAAEQDAAAGMIARAADAVESILTQGFDRTMTAFNSVDS